MPEEVTTGTPFIQKKELMTRLLSQVLFLRPESLIFSVLKKTKFNDLSFTILAFKEKINYSRCIRKGTRRCCPVEMEHINENTIRVVIENQDLEDRGITFLDLMGNQKEIEKFFYSILEEVDEEAQFRDSDAVTFQVLPNRNGLELFISKNLNLEDFSLEELPDNLPAEGMADLLKERLENKDLPELPEIADRWLEQDEFVYQLADFEAVIALAQQPVFENALTNLYLFGGKYYLGVTYLETLEDFEKRIDRALVLEYAVESHYAQEYLAEHGELLMQSSALALVHHYFKK